MAEYITEPIQGPDCFDSNTPEATLSQAAIFLLIGSRLRGEHLADAGGKIDTARFAWQSFAPEMESFRVPAVGIRTARIPNRETRSQLRKFSPQHFTGDSRGADHETLPAGLLASLAKEAYASTTHEAAAHLLEAGLSHENQLVRVAAAASYFELATNIEPLIRELAAGCSAKDPLVRDVAATVLARLDPTHPALQELTRPGPKYGAGAKSKTSMLVHGTWARTQSWWQPGGDFHTYIKANVWHDLYDDPSDRFEWSGGYSDAARALAGHELADWIDQRNMVGIQLMPHSHGGNAAMLSTYQTGKIGKLVLLSCPVHEHKYLPNFAATSDVVSIRVKMDLVILADGGGQRFTNPGIREKVLPVWFDHSASHDPKIWHKYNVPTML